MWAPRHVRLSDGRCKGDWILISRADNQMAASISSILEEIGYSGWVDTENRMVVVHKQVTHDMFTMVTAMKLSSVTRPVSY